MNQTKKRLSIIKLAISIGDIETIQLQILKLSPLKSDEKIQEIIKGLQAENYAQTQALITTYIETPTEEIIQRTSQNDILTPEEEEEIIEEFDLFKVKPETEEEEIEEILDLDSFQDAPKPKKNTHEIDYDSLLNLKSEDVLPDNIDIEEKTLSQQDDFFEEEPSATHYNYTQVIEKDDFFDTVPSNETAVPDNNIDTEELLWEKTEEDVDTFEEFADANSSVEESEPTAYLKEPDEDRLKSLSATKKEIPAPSTPDTPKRTPRQEPSEYEPITYIDQKLKNMITQYPPLEMPEEGYASVDAWLLKISNEGYTEKEVEEMILYIQKLTKEGRKAEAAQLLLISAATHSKYAQFMLARSLFKGDLLEKNLPEAFTLINRLAMDDDYAEAICDLGQLYEYGVGIDKDRKRAEELYKEAMELGIKRAKNHYERIRKENRGLFSFLKR